MANLLNRLPEKDQVECKGKNPDYFRVITLNNLPYAFVWFNGGAHLGKLYIFPPEGTPICLDEHVKTVLYKDDLPFLNDHEVILMMATGGTGEHHVFGQFVSFEKETIVSSKFPIYGQTYQGAYSGEDGKDGYIQFGYTIHSLRIDGKNIVLEGAYTTDFEGIKESIQPETLEKYGLKTKQEPFTVKITENRTVTIEGALGILNKMKEQRIYDATASGP